VQNAYEGTGTPVIRHRVRGLAEARAAAIEGEAIETLSNCEMAEGAVFGADAYEGMTELNAKSDAHDDEDDNDDDEGDDDQDDADADEDDEDEDDADEDDDE
jgi:hypothetical protein